MREIGHFIVFIVVYEHGVQNLLGLAVERTAVIPVIVRFQVL